MKSATATSDSDVPQFIFAFLFTAVGAILVVAAVMSLVKAKTVKPILGRKLLHISTGPVFCLCWLLYPTSMTTLSRLCAAIVPTIVTTYFVLVAGSTLRNPVVITTMSRSGSPSEIFRGPLAYGIVHILACTIFWTDHPAGVVSIITLCVGDGLADVIGRRFGASNPLPWSPRKSFAGSLGFILCTLPILQLVLAAFAWRFDTMPAGVPTSTWSLSFTQLLSITAVGALVESLPVEHWDNITVFGAVAAATHLLR